MGHIKLKNFTAKKKKSVKWKVNLQIGDSKSYVGLWVNIQNI